MFNFLKKKKETGLHIGKGYALDDYTKQNFLDIFQKDANRRGHTMVLELQELVKQGLLKMDLFKTLEVVKML